MTRTSTTLDTIDQQTQKLAVAIKSSVAELAAQINSLNERYQRITGEDCVRLDFVGQGKLKGRGRSELPNQDSGAKAVAKKRIRRSGEELKEMAENIFAFIKKAGSEGVKGSAIRAEFGQLLPSIKVFLKQHGGKTVKTKGSKAAMTYHHE